MTIHIPTTLSDEKVAEFKELYKGKFGEELSEGEARDTALRLIQFVGLIVKDNSSFTIDDHQRS